MAITQTASTTTTINPPKTFTQLARASKDIIQKYNIMGLLKGAGEGVLGTMFIDMGLVSSVIMLAPGVGVWWTIVGGVCMVCLLTAGCRLLIEAGTEVYDFVSNLIRGKKRK